MVGTIDDILHSWIRISGCSSGDIENSGWFFKDSCRTCTGYFDTDDIQFCSNRVSAGYFQKSWTGFGAWEYSFNYYGKYGDDFLHDERVFYDSENRKNQMDTSGGINSDNSGSFSQYFSWKYIRRFLISGTNLRYNDAR